MGEEAEKSIFIHSFIHSLERERERERERESHLEKIVRGKTLDHIKPTASAESILPYSVVFFG